MSFLFRGNTFGPDARGLIPDRRSGKRSHRVSTDEAMQNSVVWACLRLRADLISTSPVDCYRNIGGRAVEFTTPAVLKAPGGADCMITEWLYSTQVDLDRFGNCFGIITARDGLSLPARIELVPAESVTVLTKNGRITGYRIGSTVYDPSQIWHEKQYTVAGVPVGLSPLAAAALTLSTSKSAQEFAADWFAGSGVPASHLKNTEKTLTGPEADAIKARFDASVSSGDVFVTGADWEYAMLGAKASESSFIEVQHSTAADMCRFLGVPGDMVDVNEKTGSVTYANITQRNLQLLIMNLGPAVTRRESALSMLLPQPRYMKLNTDAVVLRMDPTARAELNRILVDSKQRTPSEVREKDDLPPFTPEQVAEIQALTKPLPAAAQVTSARTEVAPMREVSDTHIHLPESLRMELRQEPVVIPAPIVNVQPADVIVQPAAVTVNVEPTPITVNVEAPNVDVAAPSVTVEAPDIDVPSPLVVFDHGKRSVTFKRNTSGQIVGAEVTDG